MKVDPSDLTDPKKVGSGAGAAIGAAVGNGIGAFVAVPAGSFFAIPLGLLGGAMVGSVLLIGGGAIAGSIAGYKLAKKLTDG
jgi:hypothetical protein